MTLSECPELASKPRIEVEYVRCGLCDGDDASPYAESFDYEYQTCSNKWQFVRCRQCRNVYLNPRPRHAALPVIYPSNYYAYSYGKEVNGIARRAKALLDKRTLENIRKVVTVPLRKYLDVGCGDGRYLRVVADSGVEKENIYGSELDAGLVASLRAEGFQVNAVPFEETSSLPVGQFQLITFFSVLEHLASPRKALEQALRLLEPGGVVAFEVPNIMSLNAKLFRDRYWGGYHAPRHWNLFSISSIREIAPALGFSVRSIQRTTGHAFWLWSIHHWLRYQRHWDTLGRLFNPMKCLPGLAVVTPIDLLRAKLDMETDNLIAVLQKP